jgi:hypothetical protein
LAELIGGALESLLILGPLFILHISGRRNEKNKKH